MRNHLGKRIDEIKRLIGNDKVKEYMTNNPCAVSLDFSIKQAAELFIKTEAEIIMVVDKSERLIGAVTKSSLIQHLINQLPTDSGVKHVMLSPIISISANDPLAKAFQYPFQRLPVVDDQGKLVGLLNYTDLLGSYV